MVMSYGAGAYGDVIGAGAHGDVIGGRSTW